MMVHTRVLCMDKERRSSIHENLPTPAHIFSQFSLARSTRYFPWMCHDSKQYDLAGYGRLSDSCRCARSPINLTHAADLYSALYERRTGRIALCRAGRLTQCHVPFTTPTACMAL